jgi:hypothetical protein
MLTLMMESDDITEKLVFSSTLIRFIAREDFGFQFSSY